MKLKNGHEIKEKMKEKDLMSRKGCLHSTAFKVVCGILVIFLLFAVYNMIVHKDTDMATQMEEEQEAEREALRDTFDVVGDYLFKGQKNDPADLAIETDKDEDKTDDKKDANSTKDNAATTEIEDDNEFIESADISSDTKPVPTPTQKPAPSVEKIESPTITPIE